MYLFYETHHDLMNSLRHCTNFAVGVHSPRSSRSNYPHRRPNKLRHYEGYAQTFDSGRTGTDQLTTSGVTFSDALFRDDLVTSLFLRFSSPSFFLAPFRFCFSSPRSPSLAAASLNFPSTNFSSPSLIYSLHLSFSLPLDSSPHLSPRFSG